MDMVRGHYSEHCRMIVVGRLLVLMSCVFNLTMASLLIESYMCCFLGNIVHKIYGGIGDVLIYFLCQKVLQMYSMVLYLECV